MTIFQHIANIRTRLRESDIDELELTDTAIYQQFNVVNLELISQSLDRHQFNDFNINYFCMAMIPTKVQEPCNCIEGCTVLKSEYKIPSPVRLNNTGKVLLKVRELGNKDIVLTEPNYVNALLKDAIYNKSYIAYFINDYLYIFNPKNNVYPKKVMIGGLFQDVLEWLDIQYCESTNPKSPTTGIIDLTEPATVYDCKDITNIDYPVYSKNLNTVYNMVVSSLFQTYSKPLDNKSDNDEQ